MTASDPEPDSTSTDDPSYPTDRNVLEADCARCPALADTRKRISWGTGGLDADVNPSAGNVKLIHTMAILIVTNTTKSNLPKFMHIRTHYSRVTLLPLTSITDALTNERRREHF